MNSENSTVKGVVTQTNDRGFQLHGREGWYNWSKYAIDPRTLPASGDTISATLDKAGFVREVHITGGVTGNEITPQPAERTAAPQRGADARLRLDCLRLAFESQQWLGESFSTYEEVLTRAWQILRWTEDKPQ